MITIKKIKRWLKKYKAKRFLVFTLLIIGGFLIGFNLKGGVPSVGSQISAQELKKELKADKNFTLINVHTPYEGEVPFTNLFIPYDEIKINEKLLPTDKSASIVVYCKTGKMSKEAASTLKSMGYTNVKDLKGGFIEWEKKGGEVLDLSNLGDKVLPKDGFELPVSWDNLGPSLVSAGVIDSQKFEKAMQLTLEQKKILYEGSGEKIKINTANSRFVVNMLWAAGLAQKSSVYEKGPMGTDYKGKEDNFASTGGWTLSKGLAVNHLGKHDMLELSASEQERVYLIAQNVYRPCCGNHTAFPDCNHGMAALWAIEAMVKAGLSESEVYKNILYLNSFWFPDTYLTTATFFARQGTAWEEVDAKKVLSSEFSSAQGAINVGKKVGALPYAPKAAGGSCGT